MKTVTINVTLTDTEYDFLKLGKCDIPSPQRLKMMLLREAARNLRNMSESVLQSAVPYEDQRYMKTAGENKPPRKYLSKVDEGSPDIMALAAAAAKPKPAVGPLGHGGKHKLPPKGFAETVIDEGKRRARDERKAVSAVLTRTVASGSGLKPKRGAKPMATDGSAQPDWLDPDNIDKLRQ